MKILAIGNSFSSDATYYVKKMADSAGVELTVVNLYIGGCTLETHAANIASNAADYLYELNGAVTERMISVKDALCSDDWDIVTVQQQSGHAGLYDSYTEYLPLVLRCIRMYAPKARVYFHETWAYEIDSDHPEFAFYDRNQDTMRRAIAETVDRISAEYGLPVIPSGSAIAKARQLPTFDYANGGDSLCRDGFHMSLVYGRYLLGLVWFGVLAGVDVNEVTFVPSAEDIINGFSADGLEFNVGKLNLLKAIAAECTRSL